MLAGLEVSRLRNKPYSKEDLINIIKEKANELGRVPKYEELSQSTTILKIFGSYANALIESGLEPRQNIPNEYLLQYLRQKTIELGRSPKSTEIKYYQTINRRFGGLKEALKLIEKDS